MSIIVDGHWGPPMIMFPTSGGDEGEYERQGLICAIGEAIDAGRVKAFCVNTLTAALTRATGAGFIGCTTNTSATK